MAKKIFIILFLFSLTACSKNKSGSDDHQLPVIQLTSPTNNQVYTAGQSINITGTITDNDKIAEIHVHISNNTTAQLLEDIHRFPTSGSYSLNESFTAQTGISYKIQLIAIDKSANQQIQTVMVSAN
ncbi:MAG: Ig-like domain-containing protein [Chitinophagaceae bacterium]